MATNATIKFVNNKNKKVLVKLYNHADGYIKGLGHNIARWLIKKKIGNGLTYSTDENYCNGIGCLVTQFIKEFKKSPGGLYVVYPDYSDEWIDYQYIISFDYEDDTLKNGNYITKIKVIKWGNKDTIFEGTPQELLNFQEVKNRR